MKEIKLTPLGQAVLDEERKTVELGKKSVFEKAAKKFLSEPEERRNPALVERFLGIHDSIYKRKADIT